MAKKKQGPPRRPKGWKNKQMRPREHLLEEEVNAILKAAASRGRNRHRDYAMVLMAFRHGLRVSELVRLRWDHVSLKREEIYIERAKNSESMPHTLKADEIKALQKLPGEHIGWMFKTEKGQGHVSESSVRKIVQEAARVAGDADTDLEFRSWEGNVHPHMLRHACGYAMHKRGRDLRDIQAWLGHKSIGNTTRYVTLDADRFRKIKMWD